MAIHIKGINTELLLYKTELERKNPFSEKLVSKFLRVTERANLLPESDSPIAKVRDAFYTARLFGYGMAAFAANELEMKKRKKEIMKATELSADEVAIDINELQSLRSTRKNVKVYGDSIRYSAQIRKEWLASIETIFGDADLQALDDFSCLASLKAIYGDLNLAQCKDTEVDLSGLQVQMVYGDIHAERAKSTAGLENLLSVGGTIYYQGQDYSLEQFQQLIAADTKERQK